MLAGLFTDKGEVRIIEEALLPPAAPQKFLVADAELPMHRMPV